MATKSGEKTGGRKKGTPNKSTKQAREAIARFVDGNADRLQSWLDEIAADDPKAAFQAFTALLEFHVPKLSRAEVTGEGGGPVELSVTERSARIAGLLAVARRRSGEDQPKTPK